MHIDFTPSVLRVYVSSGPHGDRLVLRPVEGFKLDVKNHADPFGLRPCSVPLCRLPPDDPQLARHKGIYAGSLAPCLQQTPASMPNPTSGVLRVYAAPVHQTASGTASGVLTLSLAANKQVKEKVGGRDFVKRSKSLPDTIFINTSPGSRYICTVAFI